MQHKRFFFFNFRIFLKAFSPPILHLLSSTHKKSKENMKQLQLLVKSSQNFHLQETKNLHFPSSRCNSLKLNFHSFLYPFRECDNDGVDNVMFMTRKLSLSRRGTFRYFARSTTRRVGIITFLSTVFNKPRVRILCLFYHTLQFARSAST